LERTRLRSEERDAARNASRTFVRKPTSQNSKVGALEKLIRVPRTLDLPRYIDSQDAAVFRHLRVWQEVERLAA
jgi:hypothetical protein